MSNNEQDVLKVLSAANGQTVKADDILGQTGLSKEALQSAMSGLFTHGLAKWIRGSELDGKPLCFYDAWITPAGAAAVQLLKRED